MKDPFEYTFQDFISEIKERKFFSKPAEGNAARAISIAKNLIEGEGEYVLYVRKKIRDFKVDGKSILTDFPPNTGKPYRVAYASIQEVYYHRTDLPNRYALVSDYLEFGESILVRRKVRHGTGNLLGTQVFSRTQLDEDLFEDNNLFEHVTYFTQLSAILQDCFELKNGRIKITDGNLAAIRVGLAELTMKENSVH